MALHTPVYLQPVAGDAAINYSAQEWRQYTRAALTVADGTSTSQGVTTAADLKAVQRAAGANFSVDVAAGLAYVTGADVTSQGLYLVWNDGTVNVPGFTVPGSGTFNHRLVLQVQDKLNNGVWSGYQAALTPLLDTGSGTPAEPNSAITVALVQVAAGQASVLNANITDYRQRVGPVAVVKPADLARTHATTPADDPDLQLLNLAVNATYGVEGMVFFKGGSGGSEGDLQFTWRTSGNSSGSFDALRIGTNGTWQGASQFGWTENHSAQTNGFSSPASMWVRGVYATGAVAPQYLVLQWAQNTDSGTATIVSNKSFLRAVRVA